MKKVLCAVLALSMSLALSGCFLAPAILSGGESGGETTKTTVKAEPAKMGDTVKGDKWGITLQSAKLFDEIKMNDLINLRRVSNSWSCFLRLRTYPGKTTILIISTSKATLMATVKT